MMKTKWYDIVIGIFLFLLLVWHFSGCPYTLDFSRDTGMYLPSTKGVQLEESRSSGTQTPAAAQAIQTEQPKPTEKPTPSNEDVEELAWEVIVGDWSAGAEREEWLTNAGHDYKAVQDRVNEICSTIRGGALLDKDATLLHTLGGKDE